jgi:hypothetical protein
MVRTNSGHGQVAHDDQTGSRGRNVKRTFAKHRCGIDGLAFEQVIGPRIGNAFTRASKVSRWLMSKSAQEGVDGSRCSGSVDHPRSHTCATNARQIPRDVQWEKLAP